jgi:hypothetical protein
LDKESEYQARLSKTRIFAAVGMPTFIDESGDPGPEAGSSRHFRLSAVWFESRADIGQFLDVLAETRRGLEVSPFLEFHFTAMTHERRIAFFERIANTHFNFVVSAFRKDDHDNRNPTAACNSPTWSWVLSAVISTVITCATTTSAAG